MIGKIISHYKILEKLGSGGMGDVYKAEDSKLQRTVALRFLPLEMTRDEDTRQRFVHEALWHTMRLKHSRTRLNGDRWRSMKPSILRRKLRKVSLKRIQKTLFTGTSSRPIILITEEGQVKIIDFGLAKLTGRTVLTKTGTTMGTVAYMSPEQAQGGAVDHRTDIWALGVMLYEMLNTQNPAM